MLLLMAIPGVRTTPTPAFGPWLTVLLLAACGGRSEPIATPATAASEAPAGPHQIVVFATDSLRRPFQALARHYEQDHPGSTVELRLEGGAKLLAAMNAGAAADVVAIGDSSLMSRFAGGALLAPGSPAELARNRIAIAVAAGNPKNVRSLADLARPEVRTALGARSSSIGRHARWALSRLQLEVEAKAEADTAAGVLAKVGSGAADAAIVYATSFAAADTTVQRIEVPEVDNTPALYSISVTREAKEPRGAAVFRALALGPVGQQILRDAGFLPVGEKTH